MKKINIGFIDFWPTFNPEDNIFTNCLRKYYDVTISDNPDYLFCSCFGRKHFKYKDCIKIFYTGENIIPDFNLYDYSMGFHYIDFGDRYLRLPHYVLYPENIDKALNKHTHEDAYYLNKKKFCNYVISNPYAAGERQAMIDLLNEYKTVDSGGRYNNNVGGPVPDKVAFSENYRFTMAFENSKMSGYATEKIFDAFAAETIPIYWGSPRINEEFNREAFINVMDYGSLQEARDEVVRIYEDDELYLRMMKAPIITENSQAAQCLRENYLDDYMRHIFDEDIDKAMRKNMVYAGRIYQKKLEGICKAEDVLDKVKAPMHKWNKQKYKLKKKLGLVKD